MMSDKRIDAIGTHSQPGKSRKTVFGMLEASVPTA